MKLSEKIKPITYLKNHTSDVLKEVTTCAAPLIITHNGEAKLVIQDVLTYEKQQESLTLLKLLAQSAESIKNGRYKSIKSSFASIKNRILNNEKI